MIGSKRLNWVFIATALGMGLAISAGRTWADESVGVGIDGQNRCALSASQGDVTSAYTDALDETSCCEVRFESDSSAAPVDREVEFSCLMGSIEWERFQEDPDTFPERCVLSSTVSEPMFLTAAKAMPELPLTLEIIYVSDSEVQIVRHDGTRVTVKVPKGEIVNKVVQKNSPTLDREIGQEVRNLKKLAKDAGRKFRFLLKGGFKFGLPGLITLAAAVGPAFAEAVIPDTCAALRDPDRGDSCKEVINWVAKAHDAVFEQSCEACHNASLDKFPNKAAELCRAAENPATYDSVLQKVLTDLAGKCGGKSGGYLRQKNNGPLPITGVTPPALKEVCPYR